jgi:hypothetical protein
VKRETQEERMVGKAGAGILVMACMAWSTNAYADCTAGIVPERLSCLNQELETVKAQSSREIASLKADIQVLRNQLLSLRQVVDGLPPPATIARLDEDVNLLWEPQDGCLAWTGPESTPAPDGGGLMRVFAPCAKASPNSVVWRLRRAPIPR